MEKIAQEVGRGGMTLAIDTKVFKTADGIGREAIDSLVDDGFFTYGWFKTVETSKPINMDPVYVTAYDKGILVAFTPCFYDVADQYFHNAPKVAPSMKSVLNVCNRLRLGQAHVLLCYSPWCYRTKIFVGKGFNEGLLICNLSIKIDVVCKNEKILFSSFLFVSEFDKRLIMCLENLGYHKFLFWEPMLYLDVCWRSFEDYLKSLRSNVRIQVRREIKSCMKNGVTIEEMTEFKDLSTALSDLSLNLCRKYNKCSKRIDPCFYESLSDYAKANTIVFIARKKDVVVGFSMFLRKEETLDSFLGGFNYELLNKSDFTYFNLFYYTPIRWAIQEGIRKIYYRWGSEKVKYKRGCKPERIYSFVKCHNKLVNSQIGNYMKVRNRILWAR
jgi:predicted N-acyltransferase